MGTYKFNTKTKAHKFCKTCGTSIGIDFLRAEQGEKDPSKDTFGINVRVTLMKALGLYEFWNVVLTCYRYELSRILTWML